MKGFIGSANIDTNSRLCMASSVAGHRRAFGADIVPGCYEDLEQADLVVLVGANAPGAIPCCSSACWRRGSAAQRSSSSTRARTATTRDRRPASADRARRRRRAVQRPARPSRRRGRDGRRVLSPRTRTASARGAGRRARRSTSTPSPRSPTCRARRRRALLSHCSPDTERVVTLYSPGRQPIERSGTDKVNAIINCHLATGRIGRPAWGRSP